ncbi:uncharacterized protein LOC113769035 [Coffea eugenioides]|uniref:uncharacterized protein LOC113769035 n=1 Tax=Coffea eugenioides TaxID=49369 RepID=UPI000F60B815|nr:uncharacterized protein LOC113769035 [Coffea eugenioides]
MHVRKPTSFTDLRTVNGRVCASFHEAADIMGLLQTDNAAELCLSEAVAYQMPNSLRQLFAAILVYCSPKNHAQLWLQFREFLYEDIKRDSSIPIHLVEVKVLQCIDNYLRSMGKSLLDYQLNTSLIQQSQQEMAARDIETERNIAVDESDLRAIDQLNDDQRNAYEQILNVVTSNSSASFFVDGPGGTRKTFLYRALLAKIRSAGGIALATVTSGVAASILPGGCTAHSRFKIPLHDDDSKSCHVGKQTAIAQLIRDAKLIIWEDAKLIIWDEASMAKRKSIERFDEMMRDINDRNLLFGGKTVVFGGDFRQTLPVVTKGYKEDIISASLVMSPIWQQLTKLRLKENMRRSDKNFSDFLLRIGNGTEISNYMNEIKIPAPINLPFVHDTSSVETLVNMVFPDMVAFSSDPSSIVNRAILMTRNDFVHEINDMLINKFPGPQKTYLSFDEVLDTSH